MDAELRGALLSVDVDPGSAEAWFGLIADAYREANGDWDAFTHLLYSAASSDFASAAESFLRYTESNGGLDLVDRMVADLQSLPAEYQDAMAASGGPTPATPSAQDWHDCVVQFADTFKTWNGKDDHWDLLRDWLYQTAESQNRRWYAAAYEHFEPLNGQSREKRLKTLQDFGFEINRALLPKVERRPVAPPSPERAGDDKSWQTVVSQFGAGWSAWNGTEQHWVALRDWMYTTTRSQNESWYAATYQHLDPLNNVGEEERYDKLRSFGFEVRKRTPWEEIVLEYGPKWADWDGSDQHWKTMVEWLYEAVKAKHEDWFAAAEQRLKPLNKATQAVRVRKLTEFGFQVNPNLGKKPEELAEEKAAQPRPKEPWDAVVEHFNASFADWDGSQAHWEVIRDWLYREANNKDTTWYVAAYGHIDELNNTTPSRRADRLREYGFPVNAQPQDETERPGGRRFFRRQATN